MKLTQAQVAEIMASPSTSFWLKKSMATLEQRDLVDAVNDAEKLAAMMRAVATTHGLGFTDPVIDALEWALSQIEDDLDLDHQAAFENAKKLVATARGIKKTTKFVTKLGTAKKVERSRIWIEGKRLVEAGFTVGEYFHRDWSNDSLTLELAHPSDVCAVMPSKVSGKGEKPIIDITGADVRETFGVHGTHVECTFNAGAGRITIRRV